jgi:hypothetical protein
MGLFNKLFGTDKISTITAAIDKSGGDLNQLRSSLDKIFTTPDPKNYLLLIRLVEHYLIKAGEQGSQKPAAGVNYLVVCSEILKKLLNFEYIALRDGGDIAVFVDKYTDKTKTLTNQLLELKEKKASIKQAALKPENIQPNESKPATSAEPKLEDVIAGLKSGDKNLQLKAIKIAKDHSMNQIGVLYELVNLLGGYEPEVRSVAADAIVTLDAAKYAVRSLKDEYQYPANMEKEQVKSALELLMNRVGNDQEWALIYKESWEEY